MKKNLACITSLTLVFMVGTVRCMENAGSLPSLSQKICSHLESPEHFIARTEKLSPMYYYNKPKNYGPKTQFNALNKRGIELLSVIDYGTRQSIANRITILNEDRTPILILRWYLTSNDVVAAAISCDGNMLATVHHECSGSLFWNLWKIVSNKLHRIGEKELIFGPNWTHSDIIPECIDFNKQGNAVIVWGIPRRQPLTPRHCKIYPISHIDKDRIIETIE